MLPTLGRIVHYVSKIGDHTIHPAMIIMTEREWESTVLAPAHDTPREEWERQPTSIPQPEDGTVHLLVFGANSNYREFSVPQDELASTAVPGYEYQPRTWFWPPRLPVPEGS